MMLSVGAFGAAFWLRRSEPVDAFAWQPPLEQVDNRALVPATVLLPLTGAEAPAALNAALDHAHLENAYALLAYDPTLADAARLGALLQLGELYGKAKETRRAASCYQSAALLATLSPALSDLARLDTYLQVSAGLRGIGARDAARWVTDQAYLVAQHSPALRRDARVRRLEQIANAYDALGSTQLAAQARARAADAIEGAESLAARVPFSPQVGALPSAPEVEASKKTRIAAAKQLLDDVSENPPQRAGDYPADAVAQLGEALQQEDAARASFYATQLAATQDPATHIALWRDQSQWLALKYRVARGAFGVNLVPEWSAEVAAIADAWDETWDALARLYRTQATARGSTESVRALEEVIRFELIAARWGWWRGAAEQDLQDDLRDATRQAMDASLPALRLDTLTRGGRTIYWLVPDELYGAGERALPR